MSAPGDKLLPNISNSRHRTPITDHTAHDTRGRRRGESTEAQVLLHLLPYCYSTLRFMLAVQATAY